MSDEKVVTLRLTDKLDLPKLIAELAARCKSRIDTHGNKNCVQIWLTRVKRRMPEHVELDDVIKTMFVSCTLVDWVLRFEMADGFQGPWVRIIEASLVAYQTVYLYARVCGTSVV